MNKCESSLTEKQSSFQKVDIGANPVLSLQDIYRVDRITSREAYPWLLNKHYAKNIPNIMYSFGIFEKDTLVGVCCFGTPANNHNNQLGEYKMIELVRLVVNDNHVKNLLSFFVSQCFKYLRKMLGTIALVSYADAGKNHHGYVYQATNWIYTGLGGGVDYYVNKEGKEIHSRIMSDLRKKTPDKDRDLIAKELEWEKVEGTYKHRYFMFLGDKKDKAKMLQELLLKYKIEPYPKGDNVRYDSGADIVQKNQALF